MFDVPLNLRFATDVSRIPLRMEKRVVFCHRRSKRRKQADTRLLSGFKGDCHVKDVHLLPHRSPAKISPTGPKPLLASVLTAIPSRFDLIGIGPALGVGIEREHHHTPRKTT
jgi:hypothetical protein